MTAESGYSVRRPVGEVPQLASVAQHDSGVRDRGPKRIQRRRRNRGQDAEADAQDEQPGDESEEPLAVEDLEKPDTDDARDDREAEKDDDDDKQHPKVDVYA
jgi:hypothetical protein